MVPNADWCCYPLVPSCAQSDCVLADDQSFRPATSSLDKGAAGKRADADRFWRFFECAMNDLAYNDE